MFWIKADKAVPAYDRQVVKVKVVKFDGTHYIREAFYYHKYGLWFSTAGYHLTEPVYAWKHFRPIKIITEKVMNETVERLLY